MLLGLGIKGLWGVELAGYESDIRKGVEGKVCLSYSFDLRLSTSGNFPNSPYSPPCPLSVKAISWIKCSPSWLLLGLSSIFVDIIFILPSLPIYIYIYNRYIYIYINIYTWCIGSLRCWNIYCLPLNFPLPLNTLFLL